ncbi:MAG: S8 family serine peptidase [Candidatus Cryptobacteroides sp.]
MKTSRYISFIAALAFLAAGCAKDGLSGEVDGGNQEPVAESPDQSCEPGMVVVEFDDDMLALIEGDLAQGKVVTKSMPLNSALDELGIVSMERLIPDAGKYERSQREFGLHRFYLVKFDENQPVTKASVTLESIPGVLGAEKRHRIVRKTFDDPYFSNQWHYYNDGSNGNKAGADINVVPVWEQITTGSSKVIVGVVDGGIDTEHPDLAASVIPGGKNGSKNFINNSYVITAESHGTHVAGTIGAINNNGIGVCGVAGGDYKNNVAGVRLMSCQIFSEDTKGSGNSEAALVWAAQHGAIIAQNSWGYDPDTNNDGTVSTQELMAWRNMSIPSALKQSIDYFIAYAGCDEDGNQLSDSMMKGGVVIFAAGNSGVDYDPIGAYDPVISVGAIDSKGYRASYSNYGSWVDICAPGSGVYSTTPNASYASSTGTSMACPHVSGVAALIASFYGGPGFTAEALKEKLLGGANQSIMPSNSKIGPLVDAMGAISFGGENIPEKVAAYSVNPVSNSIDFTFKVTGTKKNVKAFGYILMASKDKAALESVDPRNPSSDVATAFVTVPAEIGIGKEMTVRLSGLDFETDYYVAVAGCDYFTNYSPISEIKEVHTLVNNPPVLEGDAAKVTLHAYENLTVPVRYYDPDGHQLTLVLEGGSDAVYKGETIEEGVYNIVISGRKAPAGTYSLKFTATDNYGSSTSFTKEYTILENVAPVLSKEFDNLLSTSIGALYTFDAAEYFSDADGEPLTYIVENSDGSIAHLNTSDGTFYLTTLSYGVTTITVRATDALGANVSSSFKVLVRDPEVKYLAYPNPVVDVLNLATGEDLEESHVTIVSASGTTVFDGSVTASAFEPASIDMSSCAPGRYSLFLTIGSEEYRKTIVKK